MAEREVVWDKYREGTTVHTSVDLLYNVMSGAREHSGPSVDSPPALCLVRGVAQSPNTPTPLTTFLVCPSTRPPFLLL